MDLLAPGLGLEAIIMAAMPRSELELALLASVPTKLDVRILRQLPLALRRKRLGLTSQTCLTSSTLVSSPT